MTSRVKGARFCCTNQGLKQRPRSYGEGQMVQIGPFATGEGADLLKLAETGFRQAEILQADR